MVQTLQELLSGFGESFQGTGGEVFSGTKAKRTSPIFTPEEKKEEEVVQPVREAIPVSQKTREGVKRVGEGLLDVGEKTLENIVGTFNPLDEEKFILTPPKSLVGTTESRREFIGEAIKALPEFKQAVAEYTDSDFFAGLVSGISKTGITVVSGLQGVDFAQDTLIKNNKAIEDLVGAKSRGEISEDEYEFNRNILYSDMLTSGGMEMLQMFPGANLVSGFIAGAIEGAGKTKDAEKIDKFAIDGISEVLQGEGMNKNDADLTAKQIYQGALLGAGVAGQGLFGRKLGQPGTTTSQNIKFGTGDAIVNSLPQLIAMAAGGDANKEAILNSSNPYLLTILQAAAGTGLGSLLGGSSDKAGDTKPTKGDSTPKDNKNISKLEDVIADIQKGTGKVDSKKLDSVSKQINDGLSTTKSVDSTKAYENLQQIVQDLKSGKTSDLAIKDTIDIDSIRSDVPKVKGLEFAKSKVGYNDAKEGLVSGLQKGEVILESLPTGKFKIEKGHDTVQAAKDLGKTLDAIVGDKRVSLEPVVRTAQDIVRKFNETQKLKQESGKNIVDTPLKLLEPKVSSKKFEKIIQDTTGLKGQKNLAEIFSDFKASKITKADAQGQIEANEGVSNSNRGKLEDLLKNIRRDAVSVGGVALGGQVVDMTGVPTGYYEGLLKGVDFPSNNHKNAAIKTMHDIAKGEIDKDTIADAVNILGLAEDTKAQVMDKINMTLKVDSEIKDNVYEKPLDSRLGISQKVMQNIPVVAQATRAGSKLFIDIQNKLNGVLVDFGGKTMQLGNMVNGMQGRAYSVWKSIYDAYGFGDIISFSKNNKKDINVLYSKLKSKKEDILGMMDGSIKRITELVIDSHDNTHIHGKFVHNKEVKKIEYIANVIRKMERYGDGQKTKEILDSLPQENLALVMDFINKYDATRGGIERAMTDRIGTTMGDTGILKYLREDFVHGFIAREVFEKELQSDKELRAAFSADFSYDDFLKALEDDKLTETQAEALAPILKSSKNAVVYHSESPFTRMFSYAYEVSQLTNNKDIVNTLLEVRNTNDDLKKFIPENDLTNFGKELIGIRQRNSVMKVVDKGFTVTGGIIIIGSNAVMTTSAVTTLARSSAIGLKDSIRLRTLPNIDVRNTINVLVDLGIEERYITNNIISKTWDGLYSIYGGGTADIIAKTYNANVIMKGHLKMLQVDLSGVKDSEIPGKFQETLLNLPKDKQVYITHELSKNLSDIGNFLNGSRGQIKGIQSRAFNMFKNYSKTTASRIVEFPLHTLNAIYDGVTRGGFVERGLGEQTSQMATFIIGTTIGVGYVAESIASYVFGNEEDEDIAEKRKIFANKVMGGDMYEQAGMMLFNPFNLPGVSITAGLIDDVGKIFTDVMNWNYNSTTALDVIKISGFVRSFLPLIQDDVLTVGGKYKYSNEWTDDNFRNFATFLIGYSDGRLDYEMFEKEFDKQFDLMDGEEKGMFQKLTSYILDKSNMQTFGVKVGLDVILRYATPPEHLKDNLFYQYQLKSASENNVEQIFANIRESQDNPMDVEEWVMNAWTGLDINYEGADMHGFLVSSLNASKNEIRAIGKLIDDIGVNTDPLYKGDMNKFMSEIKDTNPNMYNKILKTVAGAAVVRFDNERHKIADLEFTGKESSISFLDYMIAQHFEAKLLGSELADIVSRRIPGDITDDELGMLESLLRVSGKMPSLWDNVVDSFAVMLNDKLKNVEHIKDRVQDKPFIKELFKQGMVLKGLIFRDQDGNDDINVGQKQLPELGLAKDLVAPPIPSDASDPSIDVPAVADTQTAQQQPNDLATIMQGLQAPQAGAPQTEKKDQTPLELSDILGQIQSGQQAPQLQTGPRKTIEDVLSELRS